MLSDHDSGTDRTTNSERDFKMKNLLLTTALIAAGTAGTAMAETAAHAGFTTEAAAEQIHASDFIGMRVYAAETGDVTESEGAGTEWEDIGEINDVIMNRSGQIETVLVDIGGFLGLGERQVGVSLDQVKFVSDSSTDDAEDFFLVLNADPATLQDAPEFTAGDMEDQAAADINEMEKDAAEATASAEASIEEAGDDVAAATATAVDNTEAALDEAGDDIAAAADKANAEMEEAGDDMAAAADDAGEKVADAAESTGEAIENTADTAAAEINEETNEMQRETAEMANDSDMAPFPGTPVEQDYLTAENLDGARVYDAQDKWVGEISELIITEEGQITDAIIDVGGFLGIGEKPVALKLTDLQILRQDGGDDVRIYTAMAEEELEAMPEFEGK